MEMMILKLNARPSEIDPYRIVHHASYYNWAEICQKQYLKEKMQEWMTKNGKTEKDGICSYFGCKYIHSACEGAELVIRTTLIRLIEEETGCRIRLRHLITEDKSNQKIADLETELFFSI
jgi:acyl-CoA thioesterase FadM